MQRILPCLSLDHLRLILLLLACSVLTPAQLFAQSSDTIRVMSYNLLMFPDPIPAGRADTLKSIIEYIRPDVLMVCELKTPLGADQILDRALNTDGTTDWRRAAFVPDGSLGGDLHNLVFYRQDKLALYAQQPVRTNLRDISHYVFYLRDPFLAGHQDTTWMELYVAHLKAGNTSGDAAIRSRMVDSLRQYLDQRPSTDRAVLIGGDFNTYSSSESAYQALIDPYAPVWMRDPLNRPGSWSGSPTFSEVHTQSTRSSLIFGEGSGGGMDDRFDFILLNSPVYFGSGDFSYVPGSYTTTGNPGSCLNESVLGCEPNPVPRRVRSALYYMSDHLPVSLDLAVTYPLFNGLTAAAGSLTPLKAWWNGSGLSVQLPQPGSGKVFLHTIDGRLLHQQAVNVSANEIKLDLPWWLAEPGMLLLSYQEDSGARHHLLLAR